MLSINQKQLTSKEYLMFCNVILDDLGIDRVFFVDMRENELDKFFIKLKEMSDDDYNRVIESVIDYIKTYKFD